MTTGRGRIGAVVAVVGALAVALAACGGDGDDDRTSPAPTPPSDACGMLTRTRAEAFLGGPVGEPRTTGSHADGSALVLTCSYVRADDLSRSVGVLLRREDGQGDDLGAAVATLKGLTYQGLPTREVNGVGERAVWAEPSGLRQLTVLADDDVLVVSVGPDVTVDATTDLARDLLEHRPEGG